jgi:hypothetical protein
MTLSEQVQQPESAARVSWDVFYVGEHGFGEHLQVIAPTSKPIIEGRAQLLEWLKTTGAKPQPRDIAFPSKQAAQSKADGTEGMVRAAAQTGFTGMGNAVGRTCMIHNVPMKRIGGTAEHGRLSQNGKPYNAFWVCDAAPGCKGE